MKGLKEYILENREVLNKLPFTLEVFTTFMNESIINGEYDNSIIWGEMKDIIESNFGKIWDAFYSMCTSFINHQKNKRGRYTIEDLYKTLCNTPKERLNRIIGSGSNGIVLDIGSGKVMKIFYGDHIKNTDKPFIDWCLKNESNVFPKVYKVGKTYCTMEKLKIKTSKCKRYIDEVDVKIKGIPLYKLAMSDTNENDIPIKYREVFNWCKTCDKEMKLMGSKYVSFPGDLCIRNIGERVNGDVIFFDI